jgi:hypothetical protein
MFDLPAAVRRCYHFQDGADLVEAAAAGRALLAAHAGSGDVAAAWRHVGALLAQGLIFKERGRVNWRVAARAPVLPAGTLETLRAVGGAVDRFLATAAAALPGSRWLRERLGFPAWPEQEELLASALAQRLVLVRLDLVPDQAGAPRLIELQTIAGGLGITQGLRATYGPHPELPGVAAGLDEALRVGHADYCGRHGARPRERPLVAAFFNTDNQFRHELFVLAAALPEVEMVLTPWVRPKGGVFPCLTDGRVPDAIFRFFDSDRFLVSGSRFRDLLVRRVAADEVCLLNPWLDVLDDKRLLAVIHDDEAPGALGGAVTAADWELLRRVVPPTRRLTAEAAAALKGRPRSQRGVYLKRGQSTMSRGLIDGQQENGARFDALLERAAADGDWVVQHAVRGAPWDFTWLDQATGALQEMKGYVRLTPIYTRTREGALRLADVAVAARPQRSRVHGASDACLVVPVAPGDRG